MLNSGVSSQETVLRGIKELSCDNISYTSESEISYDFNINLRLKRLNIKALILTKQLESWHNYDFDYDNQILANNKYDAKKTYINNNGIFQE